MKNKKSIGMLFPDESIPSPDEKRITQTIAMGQEYIERHIPETTPIFGLLGLQAKYISPLLWATQFLALIVASSLMMSREPDLATAQNILFHVAPLTALFAVPEIIKDSLYEMAELESSCKNSGSIILLVRLVAVGCLNILMLSLFVLMLARAWHFRIISLILYALVPYNCAIIMSLGCIQLLKIRGRHAAQFAAFVSAAIVYAFPTAVFTIGTSALAMISAFAISAIFLSLQIYWLFKPMPNGGNIAWN
ncbi:MAG: hypothetical protein FWG30_09205 [Eubacteriaceae bacterium]|nr:hypothetical protein [Eubacteriaceae bacterium]